jgi:Astacin (Peptidase family M12A)
MADYAICTPKSLPHHQLIPAAAIAAEINPVNHPPLDRLAAIVPGFQVTRERIAVMTTKYWHTNGVKLTVGFLDDPPADLRARIISHMNAWSARLNVNFVETGTDPQVRIARTPGDGYWSYLGTDILSIDASQPTMNLDSFTMGMPESEFIRVVRHETGHTLGCPHEHMRRELVDKIDVDKAIAFFGATQGWDPDQVRRQVLTPLESSSLWGTGHSDPNSIMCYQLPGTITKDGKPIIGGVDIDESDFAFMAKVYPKTLRNVAGS